MTYHTPAKQDALCAMVEEAWYERTKGELWVGTEDDDDHELTALVLVLATYARESMITTAAVQYDEMGEEIDEVDDRLLATRIAAALDRVLYGSKA